MSLKDREDRSEISSRQIVYNKDTQQQFVYKNTACGSKNMQKYLRQLVKNMTFCFNSSKKKAS